MGKITKNMVKIGKKENIGKIGKKWIKQGKKE